MNTLLTPEQHTVLRMGLGLANFTKQPTRNWLSDQHQVGREADIEALIDMELLSRGFTHGMGGKEPVVRVTDEGRRVAMDEQARRDADGG